MKTVYLIEGRGLGDYWFPIVVFIDESVAQDYVRIGYEEDDCWDDDGLRIIPIPFREDRFDHPVAASD
jgi:hypothetical protein